MKIIWITSLFPSGSDTTKGVYLYRTVKKLSNSFDLTTLVVYPSIPPILKMIEKPKDAIKTYKYWRKNFPKNPKPPSGIEPSRIFYIRYLRLPRRYFNHYEGYFAFLKSKKILNRIISKETIIHSNWIFPSGQLAQLISKNYNLPYIVSLLGTDVHNLKYGTNYWKKAKTVLNNAQKVCSVSKQLIQKCKEEGIDIQDKKVTYIDNIYDEQEFTILNKNRVRDQLKIEQSSKIIFFAGGLVAVKNVETLIKAYAALKDSFVKIKLYLAGAGSDRSKLEKLCEETDCVNVKFLGNISSSSLIKYFNAADVFCLPSMNEGTPNVVIESLLCGTPVVASNVGGIPDVIFNNENGFVFNPNNVNELKELLEKSLLKDWDREKLRMSVSRFFSTETEIKYKALYNDIEV